MRAKDAALALLRSLPDDCDIDDLRYQLDLVRAVDRGMADSDSGRTVSHVPLVRRADSGLADLFRSVVWTASARTALTRMFGEAFDEALPRNTLLEVALDKSAYFLTTLGSAAVGAKIGELSFMYDQARLIYRIESERVVIVALVPSVARWRQDIVAS